MCATLTYQRTRIARQGFSILTLHASLSDHIDRRFESNKLNSFIYSRACIAQVFELESSSSAIFRLRLLLSFTNIMYCFFQYAVAELQTLTVSPTVESKEGEGE